MVFVVDQSLTSDVMEKVNSSLGAIQGALTPYDEVGGLHLQQRRAGPLRRFTGAQSARVPFILSMTKASGTEDAGSSQQRSAGRLQFTENGNCVDPNLQPGRSAGSGTFITIPKEIHTLNDAILAAAKELSTRPKGRRRIIYVISDGKEYGSKATYKEVIRYPANQQDRRLWHAGGRLARWGEGYISRFHLPFTMYDNVLCQVHPGHRRHA